MKKSALIYSLFLLALALPSACAQAQSAAIRGSADAAAGRVDRRCTSSRMSTDDAAPCPDDAVYDGRGPMPKVVRPPPSTSADDGSGGSVPPSGPGSPGDTGTVGGGSGSGTVGNGSAGTVGSNAGGVSLGGASRAGSP